MEIYSTIKYRGFDIEIYPDEEAPSPDEREDKESFLVYDHNQFHVQRDGFDPLDIYTRLQGGFRTYEGYWIFPAYAYIHGGVALSLSKTGYPFTCPWDTGLRGFVLVKKSTWWKYKGAREIALSVIKEWNIFLRGDVYGYMIKPETEKGSCWEYYEEHPDREGSCLLEDARGEIDYYIREQAKKHGRYLKSVILSRVPIVHRRPFSYV